MLSQDGVKRIQSLLLESFTKENEENVRHKIGDTIAEIAHTLYEENGRLIHIYDVFFNLMFKSSMARTFLYAFSM